MEDKKSQVFKIGIDARFYGPKQKGLGRYVQKLVENLESQSHSELSEESREKMHGIASSPLAPGNDQYEFVIFLRQENWSEYQPRNPNFKKVLADYRWYTLKEQMLMPLKIWQSQVDLVHFPHFNVPLLCFKPFIVTIHDLVLKRFPTRRASTLSPIRYWLKNLAYRLVIWLAIKRAKKIIAVSNYTKNDILRYFKIEPEKIEVIYEGAPELKVKIQNGQTTPVLPKLQKLNITKPYLLYVGNAYPHKNLERLILAFQKLTEDKQIDCQLVLVGELDYFYQRLKNLTENLGAKASQNKSGPQPIIFTDFVSDKGLSALYQNASLYVFPSLGEGFGLPPLEAMAHGLPVVSSRATCLPEVLGQAAIYFNPENIGKMAETIKQVLKDKKTQEKLIDQGFARIKKYRWSKMAQETLKVYQAVDD